MHNPLFRVETGEGSQTLSQWLIKGIPRTEMIIYIIKQTKDYKYKCALVPTSCKVQTTEVLLQLKGKFIKSF